MGGQTRCPCCGHVTMKLTTEDGCASWCEKCENQIEEIVLNCDEDAEPDLLEGCDGDLLGGCDGDFANTFAADCSLVESFSPGEYVTWEQTTTMNDEPHIFIHHGIIVDTDSTFGRLCILESRADLGLPHVVMSWINLLDASCASSLTVIEDSKTVFEISRDSTRIDQIIQRAYHALDNEYYYDSAADFPLYCRTGREPDRDRKADRASSVSLSFYGEGDGYLDTDVCASSNAGRYQTRARGFMSEFKIADHVCWDEAAGRGKHHGIVTDVEETEMTVMCWINTGQRPRIVQKNIDMTVGNIYLNEHPKITRQHNPPQYVLNRATRQMDAAEFKCGKDFAMYCVTGAKPSGSKCPSKSWYSPPGGSSVDKKSLQNPQTMVLPNRTNITPRNYKHTLRAGDHITWERPYPIWHHGIVIKVYNTEEALEVIHWNKDDKTKRTTILKEKVDSIFSPGKGELKRINYSREVERDNPADLVINRAYARMRETGYNFLMNNCETFATYCKTGVEMSNQSRWLVRKIPQVVKEAVGGCISALGKAPVKVRLIEACRAVAPAELIETSARRSNWVGAGIVIVIEGYHCIVDIKSFWDKHKKGEMSWDTFLDEIVKRIHEAIVTSSLVIGGSLLGGSLGAFFGPVGVLVGSIIGGTIGGLIAKPLGQGLLPVTKYVLSKGKALKEKVEREIITQLKQQTLQWYPYS